MPTAAQRSRLSSADRPNRRRVSALCAARRHARLPLACATLGCRASSWGVGVEDRSAPSVLEALWRYKWSSLALAVLLAFVSAGVSLMLHRLDVTAQARMA